MLLHGIGLSQAIPNWQWLRTQSGTNNESAPAIAQATDGSLYALTTFYSPSLSVGTNVYVNTGAANNYTDIAFTKYDAQGSIVWSKHLATGKYETGYAVAVDKWQNVYIAGTFWGDTLDVDGTILHQAPNVGGGDIFLAKYRSNGSLVWARAWGDSLSDWASSLAFDTAGNIYMAGAFNSFKLRLGAYTLNNVSSNTYTDGYISKLDTNGNVLWASRFGNRGSEYVNDIAIDKAGNAFVTGYYMGMSPHLQPDTIFPFVRFDEIYLLKYNANGVLQWGQNAGGGNNDRSFSISLDKDENPLIVGYLWGVTYFEGQQIPVTGNQIAAFMAKYHTSMGQLQWVNRYSGFAFNDIVHDTVGNMYLAGSYNAGTTVFDTLNLPATATSVPMVLGFDTSVHAAWVKLGAEQSNIMKLSANSDASIIYASGTYGPGFTWVDNVQYSNAGGTDVLLAQLALPAAQPALTLQAATVPPSCQGMANGSISLSISGGQAPYTYSWNIAETDSVANNLAEGTYAVTVYDAANDSVVYSTTLVAFPLPTAAIAATADTVCYGDSIVLSATVTAVQPYGVSWLVNGQASTTANVVLYATGPVALSVTDANHCQTTVYDTFTVLPQPSVLINASADSVCSGDSVLLTANVQGIAPYSYQWDVDGSLLSSDSIYVYAPGAISLNVSDAYLCAASASLSIAEGNCTTVGIASHAKDGGMMLYPNPAHSGITLQGNTLPIISIAIYNTIGQQVLYLSAPSNNYVQVQQLAAGIYTVQVSTGASYIYLRMVKE